MGGGGGGNVKVLHRSILRLFEDKQRRTGSIKGYLIYIKGVEGARALAPTLSHIHFKPMAYSLYMGICLPEHVAHTVTTVQTTFSQS